MALLNRERLARRINDVDNVVILRAEGGAGKTTAVAAWAKEHRVGKRLIWVSLHKEDTTPLTFWSTVCLSASNEMVSASAQRMLKELEHSLTAEHLMSLFVSTVMQQSDPVIMVVDDLDRATGEAQRQLLDVVSRLPEMKLVITTRAETPFETRLSQCSLETTVIDSRELAFTASEIHALSDDSTGPFDQAELRILRRITKGHPLATRLGLGVMQTLRATASHHNIAEITRAVDDAASGLLPVLADPKHQRYALELSLVPEVDEALANQIFGGVEGWAEVLELEDQGLGRTAERAGRSVFVMHTLVQSALRRRADNALTKRRTAEVQQLALERLRDLADPIDVMTLMVLTESDHQVFPYFAAHFSTLSLDRTAEIIALLDPLPLSRFERVPTLAAVLAAAMSEHERSPSARMMALIDVARPQLNLMFERESGETAAIVALARFALMRAAKNYEEAMLRGREYLHAVDRLSPERRTALWRAGKVQVLITAILAGEIEWAAELATFIDSETHRGRRAHMQSLQALVHALIGDIDSSMHYLNLVGDLPEGWAGTLYSVGWQTAHALRAHVQGDVQGGFDFLRPLESILPHIELWVVVLYVYGRLLEQADEPGAARKYLEMLAEQRGRPVSPGWRAWLEEQHKTLFNQELETPLSEREIVVLAALACDGTLTSVAERLFVSVNTLKTQTRHIYRKLCVAGRAEAVEVARAIGILP